MSEPILVLHWLNSIVVTDVVLAHPTTGLLGGFHLVPPLGVRSPFGIVRPHTAAEDLTGLDNGGLIWSPQMMQINVYDRERGDFTRIDPLAQRLYSILQAKVGTMADGIIHGCHRYNISAGAEQVGETIERYINQIFTIEATAS